MKKVLLALCVVLVPVWCVAQTIPGFESDLVFRFSPSYPHPGDTVHVILASSAYDLSVQQIAWSVDGATVAEGKGIMSIDVVAGDAGSETEIDAVVDTIGDAHAVLRPSNLSLLWESDAYVPPFFRGRSLASAGSNVRLQAMPEFIDSDGAPLSNENIVFTWRKNGALVSESSGRGKSSLRVRAPLLFGADTYEVLARTDDNTFANTASVRISAVEPPLVLYRNNPLLGVEYHQAFGSSESVADNELSLIAVPYFLPRADIPTLVYDWSVNGVPVGGEEAHSNELTISASGSSARARIDVQLSSSVDLFLAASLSRSVSFSQTAKTQTKNPFGVTSP